MSKRTLDNTATILVIEDDESILEAICLFLRNARYRVVAVLEGKNALAKALKIKPDLILLDVTLEGINGYDLCRKLKNETSLKRIPVLIMSAAVDLGKNTKAAKGDGFISKPFDITDMLKKIKSMLAVKSH